MVNSEHQDLSSLNEFQEELQEEYLKSIDELEIGKLITGTVVAINEDQVFIDVGYKSEGKIPIAQFEQPPKEGDSVQVILVNKEGRNGEVIVSKQRADDRVVWQALKTAFNDGTAVEGKVSRVVKGGFEISLGAGNHGFNPISKMDTMKIEEPERFLDMKSFFCIERLYNENKVNIILSRRRWLAEEAEHKRKQFFQETNTNDIISGTVKSFTSFGAFIDLGGFDGLLHINDMSWGHVTRPKDYVKKGEVLKLKVIRLDPESKKINLSLKDFMENPWENFTDRYQLDDIITGKIIKLTDFGAFIKLEDGIEGLVHISEFSWTDRIKHPKEMLKVGDTINVKILGFDLEAHKISLGIKQTQTNPWDTIEEDYPENMKLTGRVKKITSTGAFIILGDKIDSFLHRDDFSWTKKYKNLNAVLKIDDEIDVIVLESDAFRHNVRVGVKQLSKDPWEEFAKTYSSGSIIEVEIIKIVDFGIFARVENGIEGLIPKVHLGDARDIDLDEELQKYEEGQKIEVAVLDIHMEKQKLSFSIREKTRSQENQEMAKYITDSDDESKSITLAALLNQEDST